MKTRMERNAQLRDLLKEESNYIGSLEVRIEELEDLVDNLDCRLTSLEDYIADYDEDEDFNHCDGCTEYDECNCGYKDEDDCYCEGNCTKCHINNGCIEDVQVNGESICDECDNADHRKQRGRTAPNCCGCCGEDEKIFTKAVVDSKIDDNKFEELKNDISDLLDKLLKSC